MPPWTFICAIPGLDAKECVDASDVSIVPVSDPRFSADQVDRFEEVKKYLAQFRLAVVMIGGLVTSTLFTLLVLPAFYLRVHECLDRRSSRQPVRP